ncbi:hypothetical protein [Heyndrickxia sporothermodurans]|uniref:Uncharacterized protein n=1 Tax=Heyndrickxia sporothermodurans TaxID=46224 RepID=A0AB37HCA4_9BACI|nr:hypothetical protein [Heyndrickxia sporothermodurans]MBL5769347.1 hypothetical protein [Heyndrickxia sporothermodurans]MBL5773129.1 hypothetical protein [Heyndrickxia sporothermodurans]MBL5776617.1 hypothetical protein [Heyndrickxia sporothermodurans]MBL5783714.1 hypothetical protein [Heyndrickxia sporothermodurans]MBL5787216.1 hypothetical protein [Heyndrickxia sporothermodurans]
MNKSVEKTVKYSLYEEELSDLSYKPTGLIDKFIFYVTRKITSTVDIDYTINIPVAAYLRGEYLCEEISESIQDDFSQRDLISILIDDFIYAIRERKLTAYGIYHEILEREHNAMKIYGTHKVPNKELICSLKRKIGLKIEIMLNDVYELEAQNIYSTSDLIQIIYCDFIQKYKTGELGNFLKELIKRFS